MKTRAVLVALSIGLIGWFANALLSNLWLELNWKRPVVEWLARQGWKAAAGWLGVLWIGVPTFAMAALLGVLVGGVFRERWLPAACWCALGFAGASFAMRLLLIGPRLPFARSWGRAIETEAVWVLPVALLLVAAWSSARRRACKSSEIRSLDISHCARKPDRV